MATVNKIFVYGTLMNGFLKDIFPGTDLYIKNSEPGTIRARLFDLGEYPGARPTKMEAKRLTGEVHEIKQERVEQVLEILDEYEGYEVKDRNGSLYLREITAVTTTRGKVLKTWVYWYNRSCKGLTEIKEGDYNKYLKRNK